MRRTPVLCAHHIGRMTKRHWNIQKKVKVSNSGVAQFLEENNIKIYDVKDLDPSLSRINLRDVNSLYHKELPLDENHPDWKAEPCYVFGDNDLLVEGLDQSIAFTKSEEIFNLPLSITGLENELNLDEQFHRAAQKKILQSCVFDAWQEKLPKKRDPLRPAFNFPREYGISDTRKNSLLLRNLVQLCEEYIHSFDKSILVDGYFSLPIKAFSKQLQFEVTGDVIVRSNNPLSAPKISVEVEKKLTPNLGCVDFTAAFKNYHFYTIQDIYPISKESKWPYVHTIFLSCNKTEVKNEYEEDYTESQIIGRNLLKGFSIAGSQARVFYGDNVKELPEPVLVQIIMTDGKLFHFSIFQLNTLDIDNDQSSVKNIYWNTSPVALYETCGYVNGRPMLDGYNGDVLKRIFAFYKNN